MLIYSDWFPHTKPIGIFWKFWFRTFATIFVPFFLLTYFNIRIVFALTRNGTVEFVNEEQLSKAQRKVSFSTRVSQKYAKLNIF
jgi:ABC-type dipeptide/oligopeptide/nickel transport system permease component